MLSVLKDPRLWLLRGLQAVLGLTFVVVVASAIWGLLSLLGDQAAAAVARGVVIVGGILWLSVLAVLVILLVWDRIVAAEASSAPVNSPPSTDSPSRSPESGFGASSTGDRRSDA